jgi:hypothetical protein
MLLFEITDPIFPAAALYFITIDKLQSIFFSMLKRSLNFFALATPPASGDTIPILSLYNFVEK